MGWRELLNTQANLLEFLVYKEQTVKGSESHDKADFHSAVEAGTRAHRIKQAQANAYLNKPQTTICSKIPITTKSQEVSINVKRWWPRQSLGCTFQTLTYALQHPDPTSPLPSFCSPLISKASCLEAAFWLARQCCRSCNDKETFFFFFLKWD